MLSFDKLERTCKPPEIAREAEVVLANSLYDTYNALPMIVFRIVHRNSYFIVIPSADGALWAAN